MGATARGRSAQFIVGEIWALGVGLPLLIWQVSNWLRGEYDARVLVMVMPCAGFAALALAGLHHALLSDGRRKELEAGLTAPPPLSPEPEGGELALPDNVPDGALRPAQGSKAAKPPRRLFVRVTAWGAVLRQTAFAWTAVEAGIFAGRELTWGALSDPMYAGLTDALEIFGLVVVLVWAGVRIVPTPLRRDA